MLRIAGVIDRRAFQDFSEARGIDDADFVACPKHGFMGIALLRDFVVLNVNTYSSYRFQPNNFGFMRGWKWLKSSVSLNRDYLESYFQENQDNPYAIQHVMNLYGSVLKGKARPEALHKDITQYPPLNKRKTPSEFALAMQRLEEQILSGDMIFLYDRSSGLHRLIREASGGFWAHCGTASKSKYINEMTLSGSVCQPIGGFNENCDVAIYRTRNIKKDDPMLEVFEAVFQAHSESHKHYDWVGALAYYAKRKLKLPFLSSLAGISPSDIIYSNGPQLIAYA